MPIERVETPHNETMKQKSSSFTQHYGNIRTSSVAKSKPSSSNLTEFVGDITDIKSNQSLGNMTEHIGDIAPTDAETRDGTTEDFVSRTNSNCQHTRPNSQDDIHWIKGLTKSFEEEGIFGLSFGIVNAVTSTALRTVGNVGNLLTNHENNERQLATDNCAPQEKQGPAVFKFASYIADIVLSTVSPVLDLHFFGYTPSPTNDMQLSVYWDSPSIKKSIGYDYDSCSFVGTESVYFDTRSVGLMSALSGDIADERSIAESMMTDDFYSAVSREEAERMEIEFV